MKTWIRVGLVLLALVAIAVAAYRPTVEYWKNRHRPKWRFADVKRGDIAEVVNATGEVKPVVTVPVGAFVSGQIVQMNVQFNQEVHAGQILAVIDDRLYQAQVEREQAALKTRQLDVKRVEALLHQAENDEARALALQARNEKFISVAELDQLKYNRISLEAQRDVAQAAVEQAVASLKNAQANRDYCNITSPDDGIIIDRKVDLGQTVASQFQTPELFVIAPRMRERIHVHAMVDEADIGLIRAAQASQQPVFFTVDAYPDDLFEGQIEEVRYGSTKTQNVVTYPVIVGTKNADLKLLPGMTASLSFQITRRDNVLQVPNSALRFYPKVDYVRPEFRQLLEGAEMNPDDQETAEVRLSATETAEMRRSRGKRHVWVDDGGWLKAVEIHVGISDSRYSELISGELSEGQPLVFGVVKESIFGS